jgi:hypothetical protein
MRKYATTTEASIREQIDLGLTWPEVAKRLGVSLPQLRAAGCLLGIKVKARPRKQPPCKGAWTWRTVDLQAVVARLGAGEPLTRISASLEYPNSLLHARLLRRGLPTTPRDFKARVIGASQ